MRLLKKILSELLFSLSLSSCSVLNNNYVVSIEKETSLDGTSKYAITYSNGEVSYIDIEEAENEITIEDLYDSYCEKYGSIEFKDFLKLYLEGDTETDNTKVIAKCLSSCLKLYTEFKVSSTMSWGPRVYKSNSTALYCGSGVIYKINSDYTYIITNYHVVYNDEANSDNGGYIASSIVGYLYGSEDSPIEGETNKDGYTTYEYGDYGIEFSYCGGSIDYDIAVLKTKTSDIKKINENITEIEFADSYSVGETAIAIGNPENEGISVTEGIVSVDNEYIQLQIDDTIRSYRSIRIDTSIYGGSSGGGLFNANGKLIGITNAGDTDNENINYAIPVGVVKNVVKNISDNYNGYNPVTVNKLVIGITLESLNCRYVYDSETQSGHIKEDIKIVGVTTDSIADKLGIQVDDIITGVSINSDSFELNRYFELGDVLISAKTGDKIALTYTRDSTSYTTDFYTI